MVERRHNGRALAELAKRSESKRWASQRDHGKSYEQWADEQYQAAIAPLRR